ncbi:MAG: hypothetical protein EOO77_28250 [Oxalobacteraceae bacterium]|nr:MAG: hypothetical protein EOO77_28250 [Oxalobacteraceae bacterium]
MGNRVYLELRGSNLPILAEEDEEDVVSLECNNGLPLFWLALLREEDLGGHWEGEVRALYAEHDFSEDVTLEPIRLAWSEASLNLTSACASAETRLPELFPHLRAWADALKALSKQGPAEEVRLYLAENTNLHPDPDSFLGEVRAAVRLWHGPDHPGMPHITDAVSQLTGVGWLADAPFPDTPPAWRSGRPLPGASNRNGLGRPAGPVAEWVAAVLVAALILGAAMLGMSLFGPAGAWVGGLLGLALSVGAIWRWAVWDRLR